MRHKSENSLQVRKELCKGRYAGDSYVRISKPVRTQLFRFDYVYWYVKDRTNQIIAAFRRFFPS